MSRGSLTSTQPNGFTQGLRKLCAFSLCSLLSQACCQRSGMASLSCCSCILSPVKPPRLPPASAGSASPAPGRHRELTQPLWIPLPGGVPCIPVTISAWQCLLVTPSKAPKNLPFLQGDGSGRQWGGKGREGGVGWDFHVLHADISQVEASHSTSGREYCILLKSNSRCSRDLFFIIFFLSFILFFPPPPSLPATLDSLNQGRQAFNSLERNKRLNGEMKRIL